MTTVHPKPWAHRRRAAATIASFSRPEPHANMTIPTMKLYQRLLFGLVAALLVADHSSAAETNSLNRFQCLRQVLRHWQRPVHGRNAHSAFHARRRPIQLRRRLFAHRFER